MTTTDTALWEAVHAALTLTPGVRGRIAQEPNRDVHASLRLAAQIDAVLPIIRKAQAEAWDEGHRDTLAYTASGNLNDDGWHAMPTNPYAEEADQ